MMLRNRKVVIKGSTPKVRKVENRKKVSFRIKNRTKVLQKHNSITLHCGTGLCQALNRCDCISDVFRPSISPAEPEQNDEQCQRTELSYPMSSTDSEETNVDCQITESNFPRSSTDSVQNDLHCRRTELRFPASPPDGEQNELLYQGTELNIATSPHDDSSLSQVISESSHVPESSWATNIRKPSVLEETGENSTTEDTECLPVEVVLTDMGDSNDKKQHFSSNSGQKSDANSSDVIIILDSPVSANEENRISQGVINLDTSVSASLERKINQLEKTINQSSFFSKNPLTASSEERLEKSKSIDVPFLSHSRKRKHSEDSGVEILFAAAGRKRKKQRSNPSNVIIEKDLRPNVRENFSVSVTGNNRMILPLNQKERNREGIHIINDKNSTVSDEVIFLGGNDDEVSVIDSRGQQNFHSNVSNYTVNKGKNNNEPEVDDIIILDSPSSQTPVQNPDNKSERMVSKSTSVTGLIPHYTKDLLDFIPIGGKPEAVTPKMPIRRHAKVANRRYRRLNGSDLNRPDNLVYKEQQREQVIQKQLKKSQNPISVAPVNCASSSHSDTNPSSSTNEKEKSTQSGTEATQSASSSIGTNIYNPNASEKQKRGLRPIIIDGNNIAMGHGKGSHFSWRGLHICIKYFLERGHKVTAFVPTFRRGVCPPDLRSEMDKYEKSGEVVFTPSRRVEGRLIVPYDDRFIVQCAAELGGIIVSTDNYRDLLNENNSWKETIERRLLMFTWVGDLLMFPNDPLGRNGPNLEEFLQFPDK